MIDYHASILHNLDKYGKAFPLCRPDEPQDFEAELLEAMSRPVGYSSLEELDRRYPDWRDEIQPDGCDCPVAHAEYPENEDDNQSTS